MTYSAIRSSPRGKAAIASIVAISAAGWVFLGGQRVPDDVALAKTYLTGPWEGFVLKAYPDPATGGAPWTICEGDTEGVKPGMVETPAGCEKRTVKRLLQYRARLVDCIPGFGKKPLAWRAMMNSLAFNVGTGAACRSTAAKLAIAGDYMGSCIAATGFNRAAGKVMKGIVLRREMGDASRIGEAELCVSGL